MNKHFKTSYIHPAQCRRCNTFHRGDCRIDVNAGDNQPARWEEKIRELKQKPASTSDSS
jgi:hypothetical protein